MADNVLLGLRVGSWHDTGQMRGALEDLHGFDYY